VAIERGPRGENRVGGAGLVFLDEHAGGGGEACDFGADLVHAGADHNCDRSARYG